MHRIHTTTAAEMNLATVVDNVQETAVLWEHNRADLYALGLTYTMTCTTKVMHF